MPIKQSVSISISINVQQEADSLSKKEPSVKSKYCESFAKFRRQLYLI